LPFVGEPTKSLVGCTTIADFAARYRERVERERAAGGPGGKSAELAAFRWLLEELKVSLFAQELKTPLPVSWKRIQKAWSDLTR